MEKTSLENRAKRSAFLAKYATLITLVAVFIIFIFATDNFRFIQPDNLLNVLRQVSILAIVALGVTFAMAAGEMDLSTGSVVGFGCVLAMGLLSKQNLEPLPAMLIVLAMGALCGALNAGITIISRIPSIIVTLGMQTIVRGFIYMYSDGKSLYGNNPEIYQFIGQQNVGGIPILVIIMLVFIFVVYFILNKTLAGRYIYATGGNQQTARLSGINTRKYKFGAMMVCSVFSAFAGILLAARMGSGQPTAGDTYTMEALSAVFIGMTTIRVGRANVLGTIVGVFLLGVLSNGLNLLGWQYFWQDITKGAVMIAAVAISASKSELKLM